MSINIKATNIMAQPTTNAEYSEMSLVRFSTSAVLNSEDNPSTSLS